MTCTSRLVLECQIIYFTFSFAMPCNSLKTLSQIVNQKLDIHFFANYILSKKWNITKYTKSLQGNISKPVILFKTLAKANSQELWVKLANTTCLHLLSGAQCQACWKKIALAQMLCLKVVAILHPEIYISDTSKAQTIAYIVSYNVHHLTNANLHTKVGQLISHRVASSYIP
jgi:hypothetical protein